MDFFGAQQRARTLTRRLLLIFAMALVALIVLTYALFWVVLNLSAVTDSQANVLQPPLWDPFLFVTVTGAILVLVLCASLFKTLTLRGGGKTVAESLGGRLLVPGLGGLEEQRLLNVVEEMALAAGTPVPPVYILEEAGINAFAAGYTLSDAVIGVTRGAIHHLTRDELQGVIAHEFSHILQGDMRLNIRLMALIYGITVMGSVGYLLLRSATVARPRGSGRDNGNAVLVFLLLGVGLMILGSVGTLCARVIKAAVSRQREYLADAAAVQFTRNRDGISGALKRIGSLQQGSALQHPAADEVSHALFAAGLLKLQSGLFATHPPLGERIRRLIPDWDGQFTQSAASQSDKARMTPEDTGSTTQAERINALILALPAIVQRIGDPSARDMQVARQLHAGLPADWLQAAHDAHGARMLVYQLLLDDDVAIRELQLQHLKTHADAEVYRRLTDTEHPLSTLGTESRLPVLNLALSSLRQLSAAQYDSFRSNIDTLVTLADTPRLSRWLLRNFVLHHLDRSLGKAVPAGGSRLRLSDATSNMQVLLSLLAYLGGKAHQSAFEKGRQALGMEHLELLPGDRLSVDSLDQACQQLQRLDSEDKQRVLVAALSCSQHDGRIKPGERDLLATLAEMFDMPLPAAWWLSAE